MREFFKNLFIDKTTRLGFSGSIVMIFLSAGLVVLLFDNFPPIIPIFNQLPWGEERLGDKSMIFIPIAIAFGIFVFNFLLALVIYNKIPLASRILSISSLTLSVLVLFFVIRTIQLIL